MELLVLLLPDLHQLQIRFSTFQLQASFPCWISVSACVVEVALYEASWFRGGKGERRAITTLPSRFNEIKLQPPSKPHTKRKKKLFNWRKGLIPFNSTFIVPLLVLDFCAFFLSLFEVIKIFLDNCCFHLSTLVFDNLVGSFSNCLKPHSTGSTGASPSFLMSNLYPFPVTSMLSHSQHWIMLVFSMKCGQVCVCACVRPSVCMWINFL